MKILDLFCYNAYMIRGHIRAVLFDYDDTLVETIAPKWAQHKFIAKKYYTKELSDKEIIEHWGKPMGALFGLLYGTDDIALAFENYERHHNEFPKTIFADTANVLRAFHQNGLKIGLVTAANKLVFEHDFEHLDFPHEIIDYMQTEEDTKYHKPDPRVFDPTIKWLATQNIKPAEAVYIGDGLHDMKAALGAGFEFIGVETGLVTQKEFKIAGAKSIKTLKDLIHLK